MHLKRVHMQFSVCLLSALSGVLLPRVVCLCICMRVNMQMALSAVVCVYLVDRVYIYAWCILLMSFLSSRSRHLLSIYLFRTSLFGVYGTVVACPTRVPYYDTISSRSMCPFLL